MSKSKKTISLFVGIAFLIVILIGGIIFFSKNKASQSYDIEEVASTIRLMKTEGDVSIQNTNGSTISTQSQMKLYNGYQITTSSKSYAWLTFDEHKLVKVDANSIVEVQKKKEKITLYVVSGNLFFNVNEPLKAAEGFHVKTSTMTMGIRGTSGVVTASSDGKSEIRLLTGKVHVYVEEAVYAENTSYILTPGNLLQCNAILDEKKAETIVVPLAEKDISKFAATEIAEDEQLQERIKEESDLTIDSIIEPVAQIQDETIDKNTEIEETNDTTTISENISDETLGSSDSSNITSSNPSTQNTSSHTNSNESTTSSTSQNKLEEGNASQSTEKTTSAPIKQDPIKGTVTQPTEKPTEATTSEPVKQPTTEATTSRPAENPTEGTTSAPAKEPTTEATTENTTESSTSQPVEEPTEATTSTPVQEPTTESTTSQPVEKPTEGTTSAPVQEPTTESTTSQPVVEPTTESTTSQPVEEPEENTKPSIPSWWEDFWGNWKDFWEQITSGKF